MKNLKLFGTIVLAVVLFAAVLLSMNTAQADIPGPLVAPTPVSASVAAPAPGEVVLFSNKVLTEDVYSTAVLVKNFQRTDIQHIFDQTVIAAAANTTTLTIQFSNDGTNYTDGAALVSSNADDASLLQQVAVFGKYARVYANVSNSNPVTLTVIGVLK